MKQAPNPDLVALVGDELSRPVPDAVTEIATELRRRHRQACVAILFYGSCLRLGAEMLAQSDAMLDFYVLVDEYRNAYPTRPLLAFANRVLPPNVFYAEIPVGGRTMRMKYALMTVAQFERGCRMSASTSAIWARFAQPARLVFAGDDGQRVRVIDSCATAIDTFVNASLAFQDELFEPDRLWKDGFRRTYGAELRSERGDDRAASIVAADAERYRRMAAAALGANAQPNENGHWRNPLPPAARRSLQGKWRRWRRNGKWLNLLRLIKAVFTFDGAVDYALWKVERHAGVRPPVSAWERRHPILAAPVLLWRFHRAGAFR